MPHPVDTHALLLGLALTHKSWLRDPSSRSSWHASQHTRRVDTPAAWEQIGSNYIRSCSMASATAPWIGNAVPAAAAATAAAC
jgi:hypothetical protein